MEPQRLLWLFFSFSGRIDRRVFALAGVLLLYWACLWVWQRTTGETLRLTGFRAA